jgi:hypothetical protein
VNQSIDRLPPHSIEAEQGVLGCILQEPVCFPQAEERFKGERVFFSLAHHEVFTVMGGLQREGKPIDLITVQQRLKDANKLDGVGGVTYLSSLIDLVPSAANLPAYLTIVWEKFLARQLIRSSTEAVSAVFEAGGITEPLLERIKRAQADFEAKSQRGTLSPRFLKPAADFSDQTMARFFGGLDAEPGHELPIGFPFKIRRQESTLFTGDSGAGKSTVLSYFGIHMAALGEKLCIASFEMPASASLWIMASQLLGTKYLPDTTEGHRKAVNAIAWLNERVLFYDFLGIGDWRDILDTFRYAAKRHNCSMFILDSVMRIGIPDDDYAGQGLAAAYFAQFAMDCDAHLFYVVHQNKGEKRGKDSVRGSKQWTDNANNVLRIEINSEKEIKAGEARNSIKEERRKKNRDDALIKKCEDKLESMKGEWDSHLVLQKQRYPGTRQNASAHLWFDRESFQFRDRPDDVSVNWMERWKRREKSE